MTWLILLCAAFIVYRLVIRLKARPRPGPWLRIVHSGKVYRQALRAEARRLAWSLCTAEPGDIMMFTRRQRRRQARVIAYDDCLEVVSRR